MRNSGFKKNSQAHRPSHDNGFEYFGKPISLLWNRHQLGVVVGQSSISICLLNNHWRGYRVLETKSYDIEETKTTNWHDKIEEVTRLVKAYLEQKQITGTRINISLTGHDIGFRRISLPHLPNRELASAVAWESKTQFPFDISTSLINYEITDRTLRDDVERYNINVTAANRKIVEYIYSKFKQAGLKPGQVNFLPVVLSQVPYPHPDHRGEYRHLVLYFGRKQSYALFIHKGKLEFYQEFITRPIGAERDNPVIENMRVLMDEFESFLDLYNAQGGQKSLEGIILCGHYGSNEENVQSIAAALGLPCRSLTSTPFLQPMSGKISVWQINDDIAPVMAALGSPLEHVFIPEKYLFLEKRNQFIGRVALIGGLAAAAMGIIQAFSMSQEHTLQKRLQETRNEIVKIEKSEGYLKYQNLLARLKQKKEILLKDANQDRTHIHLLLKELSLLAADNITLFSIVLDRQNQRYELTLDGSARIKDFSPEILLAGYVDVLENSPFFENVEVITHSKRQDQNEANLSFQLKMDARV